MLLLLILKIVMLLLEISKNFILFYKYVCMSKIIKFVYKIEAIETLLDKNALLSRYYPLIPFKNALIKKLKDNGILTNYDALKESSTSVLLECLKDEKLLMLLKKFLLMYEVDEAKLRKIDSLNISDEEKKSYLINRSLCFCFIVSCFCFNYSLS